MAVDVIARAMAANAAGGGSDSPIIISAESNTTVNGYQVPVLTLENIQNIYNGFIAGKEVVVSDATDNMHFKVYQVDTDTDNVYVLLLYYDVMILQYDENGNILYTEIGGSGESAVGIPFAVTQLEDTATSSEIVEAFGGKDKALQILNSLSERNKSLFFINDYDGGFDIELGYCYVWEDDEYTTTYEFCWHSFNEEIYTDVSYNSSTDTFEITGKYNDKVLTTTNTNPYTPTQPTHPATKGYVDDAIGTALGGSY